jgi:hypothetical protein
MTAKKVGDRLVELVRKGKNMEAIEELYSKTIESVEAVAPPQGGDRVSKGIDAVRAKNQWWAENHEVHAAEARGPFPHGEDRFCVNYSFDVTFKPANQRMKMEEVALYTVADGKIVKEEFFYSM